MGETNKVTSRSVGPTTCERSGHGVIAVEAPSDVDDSSSTRIGLLSWSQRQTQEGGSMVVDDLIASLKLVQEQRAVDADLILCSGVGWFTESNEGDAAIASRITAAAGGRPVLLEWPECDRSAWWLAAGNAWSLVRQDQYIRAASEARQGGRKVLAEMQAGFGMIQVGAGPILVLLICNEARMLARNPRDSILIDRLAKGPSDIPDVFRSDWVALHPSHRPYAQRTHRRGWDLLGRTTKNGDGLFQSVTSPPRARADGTRGPRTVLHAGPWQPEVEWQRRAAVSKFSAGKRWRSWKTTTVAGLTEIRYAQFKV